ncbi:MAG: YqgE/AlgH family protein [Pseudomonadota bacterium]|nr:MAG: YqgE/AlgH family protein [Pseudomonadota bacterium]
MSYLEQQFLIAMPGMQDPNFARGVTLLCQHNDEGALGITINRVSDFTLKDVLEQLDIECDDEAIAGLPVFAGGPVQPERGFVLHSKDSSWDATVAVGSDILVTTSRDVLEAIAGGRGPEKYLVALGYAGWESGQLETEMRENAWLNVMASSEIVFDLPVERRWEQAVARLGIDISSLQPAGGHA